MITFSLDLLNLALVWRVFADLILSLTYFTDPTKILNTMFNPALLPPVLASPIVTRELFPHITLLSFTRALFSLAGAMVMSQRDKVWVLGIGLVGVVWHLCMVWSHAMDVKLVGVRNDAAYRTSKKIHGTEAVVLSLILCREILT